MTEAKPFTLSIETEAGKIYQHPYHLGTDERLARQITVEKFHARVTNNLPVVTIALLRNGKIVDVFMGDMWSSEYDFNSTGIEGTI